MGWYKRDKNSSCSAWPWWYVGFCCGRYGLGVVRETWGWRFMLGRIDYCVHLKTEEGGQ